MVTPTTVIDGFKIAFKSLSEKYNRKSNGIWKLKKSSCDDSFEILFPFKKFRRGLSDKLGSM